ncbi:hypothetical protein BRADI_3g34173v3 [Brachypodium distachyon]|uniref:Uncharacterized protein n=1 Tax=Brachypodium distachyon TaxID=15368 RepID=A0A2K2D0Z4_BRADI|nr:hypothetical protein BRADI_3g34173v3 [Brachypodium distachyon]
MSLGKQGYVFLSYAFDQILWYLAHIFASFKKVRSTTQLLISYLYLSGAQSTLFFANGCTIYCLNGFLIIIVYIESQAELHGLFVSINYCSNGNGYSFLLFGCRTKSFVWATGNANVQNHS